MSPETPPETIAPRAGGRCAAWRPSGPALARLAVAAGLVLRVWEYLDNRALYQDEIALLENLVGHPVFEFSKTLTKYQLAPPGFLVVERLMVRLPIAASWAGRLVPLLLGIASVVLFRRVAERFLERRAVPLALGLFAVTDYLLYYSAEIKPYSTDVALTLAAWLLATAEGPRRSAALAVFGAVAPWFSYPVCLVLPGAGLYRIVQEWRQGDRRRALGLAAAVPLWGLSVLAVVAISDRVVSHEPFLQTWWAFAFFPAPPTTLAAARGVLLQVANAVLSPGGIRLPWLTPPWEAAVGSTLVLFGSLSLARRRPGALFLILSPWVLAFAASMAHRYPFHGRLLLFLVPSVHLLVGEAVAAIGRRAGLAAVVALAVLLLARPTAEAFWHLAVVARMRPFDSHGDLWPDLLDYLDARAESSKAPNFRQTPGSVVVVNPRTEPSSISTWTASTCPLDAPMRAVAPSSATQLGVPPGGSAWLYSVDAQPVTDQSAPASPRQELPGASGQGPETGPGTTA